MTSTCDSNREIPEHLQEVLHPLLDLEAVSVRRGVTSTYSRQLNEVMDMDRRFRNAEALFGEAYTQVSSTEKAVANYQKIWQNDAHFLE